MSASTPGWKPDRPEARSRRLPVSFGPLRFLRPHGRLRPATRRSTKSSASSTISTCPSALPKEPAKTRPRACAAEPSGPARPTPTTKSSTITPSTIAACAKSISRKSTSDRSMRSSTCPSTRRRPRTSRMSPPLPDAKRFGDRGGFATGCSALGPRRAGLDRRGGDRLQARRRALAPRSAALVLLAALNKGGPRSIRRRP